MNLRLLHVLNQLSEETEMFLHEIDPDLDRWEMYMARRRAIFAELQDLTCSAEDLTEPALLLRKEEILRQEMLVHERAQAKLTGLRTEMRTLAEGRRALHGYGPVSAPILFERNL